MSHKLGGTNSVLLLPFSIINLIKFQKTNLKEERGIPARSSTKLPQSCHPDPEVSGEGTH